MRKQFIFFLSLWLGLLSGAVAQNYPSLETFGKNRIQYRQFNWKLIRTSNFEIYFYQDGNAIANLTAQYAESEFDRITELLGYTPYNRIKIFLYNSPQELSQSNIGITAYGTLNSRETDLAKSRIELAFTGDQVSFRQQLIHDVSMLFVYDMLYGGSLKDALQSSLLLTLPDWFMPGIATYIAEGWNTNLDDYMRDVSLNRPVRKPSTLSGREAQRVGQSIWNYVAQKYGRDNIANILNLTRIIRNEQSSIASTLGVPYGRFLREWREYYTGMATPIIQATRPGTDDFRVRISTVDADIPTQLNDLKLSADKQFIAYSTVRDGRFSVEVVNTANRKKTRITQGGYRLDGQSVRSKAPLVAWQRENLAVLTDEEGKTYLSMYGNFDKTPKLKQKRLIQGLSQVVSMDASDDGSSLLFSADRRGQNDVFLYSIGRGTYQQLTNDLYDDIDPQFVGRTTRQIVFASNRHLDTMGVDKGTYRSVRDRFSLFMQEGGVRATSVTRLTDSLTTATRPIAANESVVYYLSDTQGIRNLYRLDTADHSVRQVTAFPYSIQQYDLNPSNGGFVYSSIEKGALYIGYRASLNLNQNEQPLPTQRVTSLNLLPKSVAVSPIVSATQPVAAATDSTKNTPGQSTTAPALATRKIKLDPGEVDTDNYQFDPDVLKAVENRQRNTSLSAPLTTLSPPRNRRRENITIRGPFNYQGLFVASDASSNWRIDPIRGFGYTQTVTLNDLLENHVIRAGLFITTTLKNSDLFAEYQNLEHRIDYGVRVDRSTLYIGPDAGPSQKYRYNRVAMSASYPISVNSRFVVTPSYTLTRLIDLTYLSGPQSMDRTSDYAGLRAEYVFDNTEVNGMNLVEGTRLKLKYDQYAGLQSAKESFNRVSLDARHYQRIHRDLTLAVRLSYSQSGGAAPKRSTLGGMENWIGSNTKEVQLNNPLIVPNLSEQNIGDYRDVFFLDFVAPLRGFRQGKLTGNSHLLFNAELRLPLIKYLYRGNITSNFLRNLQLVAFSDIGTAWSGRSPFNRQNSLNTETYPKGIGYSPFRATVTNFKNPFLLGYGIGARTMLFGYYIKFDYAWGVENKVVGKAIPYLTLGYDF